MKESTGDRRTLKTDWKNKDVMSCDANDSIDEKKWRDHDTDLAFERPIPKPEENLSGDNADESLLSGFTTNDLSKGDEIGSLLQQILDQDCTSHQVEARDSESGSLSGQVAPKQRMKRVFPIPDEEIMLETQENVEMKDSYLHFNVGFDWMSTSPTSTTHLRSNNNNQGSTCSLADGCIDGEDEIDINALPLSDGAIPHPSYKLTQSLIAQKMSQLSMKERESVYYDIHGVRDALDEEADQEFVDRKLKEMTDELLKMEPSEKEAYEQARSSNSSYVDSRDFQIRFLRTDSFDPKLAATRYAKHFQLKLDVFGKDKLGRDIQQDDLSEEALDSLYGGASQALPQRDAAGRLIWLWISSAQQQSYSQEAAIQRLFYNAMRMSEDVETQKKGSILVVYMLGQQQTRRGYKGQGHVTEIARSIRALPISIASVHCVFDNYAWLPVLSIGQLSFHLFTRLRIRNHYGSHQECMYKLQTFGIRTDTFPIDKDGTISLEHHRKSLEGRRREERERTSTEETTSKACTKIVAPGRCDVLLGRGKGYFNHDGNVRYRGIIEDFSDQYERSLNKGKKFLTREVVRIVHEYGGRFLRESDGAWVEVDDDTARNKVSHSYRAFRSSFGSNKKSTRSTGDGKRASPERSRGSAPPLKQMRR